MVVSNTSTTLSFWLACSIYCIHAPMDEYVLPYMDTDDSSVKYQQTVSMFVLPSFRTTCTKCLANLMPKINGTMIQLIHLDVVNLLCHIDWQPSDELILQDDRSFVVGLK